MGPLIKIYPFKINAPLFEYGTSSNIPPIKMGPWINLVRAHGSYSNSLYSVGPTGALQNFPRLGEAEDPDSGLLPRSSPPFSLIKTKRNRKKSHLCIDLKIEESPHSTFSIQNPFSDLISIFNFCFDRTTWNPVNRETGTIGVEFWHLRNNFDRLWRCVRRSSEFKYSSVWFHGLRFLFGFFFRFLGRNSLFWGSSADIE